MKTLRESLFDQDINADDVEEAMIRKWLEDKYKGSFIINVKKHTISSRGHVRVEDTSIDRLLPAGWRFNSIRGDFSCMFCKNLKSLEGAPIIANRNFNCSYCDLLESLEGAPDKVNNTFYCSLCGSLKSLEGAPKIVNGDFNCSFCSFLKSLEGAPEIVKHDFVCHGCPIEDYSILDKIQIDGDIFK